MIIVKEEIKALLRQDRIYRSLESLEARAKETGKAAAALRLLRMRRKRAYTLFGFQAPEVFARVA